MGRPTLPRRTREVLVRLAAELADPARRWAVLVGGLVLALVAHGLLQDSRLAWLVVPLVVLGGLAGGVRTGLTVAGVAAGGHLAVDVWLGLDLREVPGLLARTAALGGLALVGAAGQHVEQQRDRAVQRAIHEDPVTGLLNVRAFYEALADLRVRGVPFTIVLADVRGMRALNDRYGHPTGTEAMRALAHVLRRSTGADALLSRLGSDEVAVALPTAELPRPQGVVDEVVRRLHDELVSLPDGQRFEIHAAYGIASFPDDGDDEVAVLRAADRAKERAKAVGLDRVGMANGEVL